MKNALQLGDTRLAVKLALTCMVILLSVAAMGLPVYASEGLVERAAPLVLPVGMIALCAVLGVAFATVLGTLRGTHRA